MAYTLHNLAICAEIFFHKLRPLPAQHSELELSGSKFFAGFLPPKWPQGRPESDEVKPWFENQPEKINGGCIMSNEIKAQTNGSDSLFGNDLSKGSENTTQEHMALPSLRIPGKLSPQVTDGDAKYISGAHPRQI